MRNEVGMSPTSHHPPPLFSVRLPLGHLSGVVCHVPNTSFLTPHYEILVSNAGEHHTQPRLGARGERERAELGRIVFCATSRPTRPDQHGFGGGAELCAQVLAELLPELCA